MIAIHVHFYKYLLLVGFILLMNIALEGQEGIASPEEYSRFKPPVTRLWINTYGNIRISNKLSWIAQTHFRFQESKDLHFVGQIGQIYNRHAINYLFSKNFNASLGGVLRVNYNVDEVLEGEKSVVPEFRIWHEYLFGMPLDGIKVYHRIRIEHRWSKGFKDYEPYIFRNRWRYMLNVKIPINNTELKPKTFYISPEAELIMQSGKAVVDSPMEDLRLHASCGYIINRQLTIATGFMYSMGQTLKDGDLYHQKYTVRTHLYFSPDFRKLRNRSLSY